MRHHDWLCKASKLPWILARLPAAEKHAINPANPPYPVLSLCAQCVAFDSDHEPAALCGAAGCAATRGRLLGRTGPYRRADAVFLMLLLSLSAGKHRAWTLLSSDRLEPFKAEQESGPPVRRRQAGSPWGPCRHSLSQSNPTKRPLSLWQRSNKKIPRSSPTQDRPMTARKSLIAAGKQFHGTSIYQFESASTQQRGGGVTLASAGVGCAVWYVEEGGIRGRRQSSLACRGAAVATAVLYRPARALRRDEAGAHRLRDVLAWGAHPGLAESAWRTHLRQAPGVTRQHSATTAMP